MVHDVNEDKCFSYIWKIENVTYYAEKCAKGIESPSFVVDEMEGITWKLRYFPTKGDFFRKYCYCGNICVKLYSKRDDRPAVTTKVKFEIALIGKDGSDLISQHSEFDFEKGFGNGFDSFAKWKEVYDTKRSTSRYLDGAL
ncbi:hypothetical protein AVEN_91293-1 [Araneus ventricosus]|uniref:MATH domain-containing protein n=1 Tax=Araneus ventricosus TaxID=182803 RepID=A0A4Y2ETE5_ARAVE|nr:hypothetical protein AVEN_91293-1 [Araneus ventricosus]